MKGTRFFPLLAVSAGLASIGFADAENTECCGVLFWVFISFGVLVVLAQLIPAVLVITGFIRGFPIKQKTVEPVKEDKGGGA